MANVRAYGDPAISLRYGHLAWRRRGSKGDPGNVPGRVEIAEAHERLDAELKGSLFTRITV